MLIITRRVGESILLGEEIEIQVTEASASRVSLGIRAPRQLPVKRKEVIQASAQNRQASQPADGDALARLLGVLRKTP